MSRKKARRRSIPRQVRDDVASRGLTGQVGAFPGARVALAREVGVGELGWVLSPNKQNEQNKKISLQDAHQCVSSVERNKSPRDREA